VSNIPSSPPGIILAFCSTLSKKSPVVVVNCSLSTFQGDSFSTLVHPCHRLCVGRPNSGKIWCSGGQVS
jgi:hypothetical protein